MNSALVDLPEEDQTKESHVEPTLRKGALESLLLAIILTVPQDELEGTTWKRQELPPRVGWRVPEGEVKWREETGQLRSEAIGAGNPTLSTAVVLRFQ